MLGGLRGTEALADAQGLTGVGEQVQCGLQAGPSVRVTLHACPIGPVMKPSSQGALLLLNYLPLSIGCGTSLGATLRGRGQNMCDRRAHLPPVCTDGEVCTDTSGKGTAC